MEENKITGIFTILEAAGYNPADIILDGERVLIPRLGDFEFDGDLDKLRNAISDKIADGLHNKVDSAATELREALAEERKTEVDRTKSTDSLETSDLSDTNGRARLLRKFGIVGGVLAGAMVIPEEGIEGAVREAVPFANYVTEFGSNALEENILGLVDETGIGVPLNEIFLRPSLRSIGGMNVKPGILEEFLINGSKYTASHYVANLSYEDIVSRQKELLTQAGMEIFPSEINQQKAHIALRDEKLRDQYRSDFIKDRNIVGLHALDAFEAWEQERLDNIARNSIGYVREKSELSLTR